MLLVPTSIDLSSTLSFFLFYEPYVVLTWSKWHLFSFSSHLFASILQWQKRVHSVSNTWKCEDEGVNVIPFLLLNARILQQTSQSLFQRDQFHLRLYSHAVQTLSWKKKVLMICSWFILILAGHLPLVLLVWLLLSKGLVLLDLLLRNTVSSVVQVLRSK